VRRLTDQEGQRLRHIVRRGSTSSVRYRRAMTLLTSAGGNRVPVIAQLVQADEDTVRDVIHQSNEIGLACLRKVHGRVIRIGREAELNRIEEVLGRFPDRVVAFDEFGPLGIRPTTGSAWDELKHPDRVPATHHCTHGVCCCNGCRPRRPGRRTQGTHSPAKRERHPMGRTPPHSHSLTGPRAHAATATAVSRDEVLEVWSWCRVEPQRRAWRIFNRPNPMAPKIRIFGPPGRERRGAL
jgi:hypothetical protein